MSLWNELVAVCERVVEAEDNHAKRLQLLRLAQQLCDLVRQGELFNEKT